MAPVSIEVVDVEAEAEEAETAVEETGAVSIPNSPHPSVVAPTLLAIVSAVLESADPIEAA